MADVDEKKGNSDLEPDYSNSIIDQKDQVVKEVHFFPEENSSNDNLVANKNNFINIDEWKQLAGSRNTKRVTASSVKLLRQFINETNGGPVDFENFDEPSLIYLLMKFFTTVRKPDGDLYTKNGLLSIRFGLRRYLLDLHKTDITKHSRLNSVFNAQINKLKREGKGKINHYPPISQEDMVKIYTSGVFALDNPKSLLRKVFFETEMFFYRRGRENLRDLTDKHFKISVDAFGKKYLSSDADLDSGPSSRLFNRSQTQVNVIQNGLIYETGTAVCPVTSFEKFLSKRHPSCAALFQRPLDSVPLNDDEPWYHRWGLGLNKMTNMMREISIAANLSKLYTNHSIRATSKSVFDVIWSRDFSLSCRTSHKNDSRIKKNNDVTNLQEETIINPKSNSNNMSKKTVENPKANFGYPDELTEDVSTSQNYLNPSSSSPTINSYNLNDQNSVIETKPLVNQAELKKQQLEFLEAQMLQADAEAKKRQAEVQKRQAELAEAKKLAEEERLRKEAENKVYKYMVLNHEKKILETLRALWKGNQFCDATLQNECISIPVHKILLIACCPKILETYDYIMKDSNVQVCFPRKVTADALKAFVDYLYNGSLNLSKAILESMEYLSGMLGLDDIRQLCNQFRSDMLNDSLCLPDKTIVNVSNSHNTSTHQMSYNDSIIPPPPIVRPSAHTTANSAVSIQLASNFQDMSSAQANNFNLFPDPHSNSILTEVSHIKLEPEVDLTAEDCTEIKQESIQNELYAAETNCKFTEWSPTELQPHLTSQTNFLAQKKSELNNYEMTTTVDLSMAPLNSFQKQSSKVISSNTSSPGVITISPSNSPCPSPRLTGSSSDIHTIQISNTHSISNSNNTNPFPVSLISANGQSISLTDQNNKRKSFENYDSNEDRKRTKILLN